MLYQGSYQFLNLPSKEDIRNFQTPHILSSSFSKYFQCTLSLRCKNNIALLSFVREIESKLANKKIVIPDDSKCIKHLENKLPFQ